MRFLSGLFTVILVVMLAAGGVMALLYHQFETPGPLAVSRVVTVPRGEGRIEIATRLEREGATAEIGYRLSLEPIWPSRIEHEIHLIRAAVERALRFANLASLEPFGIDVARYRTFDYRATQALAAAAHFLEFDGLVVPNARFDCANLVLFTERNPALALVRSEPVDWDAWRRSRRP